MKAKEDKKKANIVIVGSGFAGIYTYLELIKSLDHSFGDIRIILISDRESFEFTPMIHEVATGNLSPSSISQSVRILPDIKSHTFIHGIVSSVDLDKKELLYSLVEAEDVDSEIDSSKEVLKYDYLVLALGSKSDYFNIPGARENTLSLKNIEDSKIIKNTIIKRFESASRIDKSKIEKHLRFVIIGGGPTGVELAGEISDLVYGELKDAFPKDHKHASVLLISRGDTLVKNAHPWFGKEAERILTSKGVKCKMNFDVKEITKEKIISKSGEEVLAHKPFWTGGVTAQSVPIEAKREVEMDERSKRIKVNEFLQIPAYKNVYVAGDQAYILDKDTLQPYNMRAQFATREGYTAAHNIVASLFNTDLEEFEWDDSGFILSLGKGGALAEVRGFRFSGFVAWWLYRTAYLFKMLGTRAKFRVALEWTLNLFTKRDISEL